MSRRRVAVAALLCAGLAGALPITGCPDDCVERDAFYEAPPCGVDGEVGTLDGALGSPSKDCGATLGECQLCPLLVEHPHTFRVLKHFYDGQQGFFEPDCTDEEVEVWAQMAEASLTCDPVGTFTEWEATDTPRFEAMFISPDDEGEGCLLHRLSGQGAEGPASGAWRTHRLVRWPETCGAEMALGAQRQTSSWQCTAGQDCWPGAECRLLTEAG